jgi:hypothetical protein
MASDAQLNANRENAKFSHGALTPETKKICSMNAVKHGLCAQSLILAKEDVAAYEKSVAIVFDHYQPKTDMEKLIIQEVADLTWKLLRVPVVESGIFAKGRLENQYLFGPDIVDPAERHIIVEGEIQHTYSRALANLTLQQSRSQRMLEKKIAAFEELRHARELLELAKRNSAMNSIRGKAGDPYCPHPSIGVVYSLEFLTARLEFIHAAGISKVLIFDRAWGDTMAKTPA